MPVLDNETGESLEYIQPFRHPKYKKVCNTSYSNELGRFFQGVVSDTSGEKKQRGRGTATFRVIKFESIPHVRWKEIYHISVVCGFRPNKDDPNCTRITVAGNRVSYPGDVATPGTTNGEPIQFLFIVDDFGVDHVGRKHAEHLDSLLKIIMKYQRIGKAKILQASN